MCVSHTQENCEDRQGNKLSLNIVKTQATVIGSRPKLSQLKSDLGTFLSFKIVGVDIDLANKTKYLGVVMIDRHCLSWSSQIWAVNQKTPGP